MINLGEKRKIAWAAATDAANRNMAKNGRDHWTDEDYDIACREYARLNPEGGFQP